MDLREADDVETRLGPFGPDNITMKVALQEFLLNAFALFPCWYTFAMFSATLHRRPRVNDERKRSLRNLNTAKLDGLFSVLCAVCAYCVSCVQAVYISSRMDRNTISCSTGLPCRGSGGSSWGLVMCILRLPQKSTARFCERARSKRRGGSKTLGEIVHFFCLP